MPAPERPDLVVVIADAAHLARSVYLVAQLRERDQRLVVALTMTDVAARDGVAVDAAALSAALGVPVAVVDPRRRDGLPALADAVRDTLAAEPPAPRSVDLPADADDLDRADERFGWINAAVLAASARDEARRTSWSDRVDRFVTAPVLGPLVFLAVMWGVSS